MPVLLYYDYEVTVIRPSVMESRRNTIFVEGMRCPYCHNKRDRIGHGEEVTCGCGTVMQRSHGRLKCQFPDGGEI